MANERQIKANRLNALKSTGPQTPEGRAAVRHNALRHGLLSHDFLLPDEDAAAFQEFRGRLLERLRPEGELEELLADRVSSSAWRLRRVLRVEAELFGREHSGFGREGIGYVFELAALGHNGDAFSKLSRYETAIERGLFKALHELQRLLAARRGEDVPPPTAVDVNVTGAPDTSE